MLQLRVEPRGTVSLRWELGEVVPLTRAYLRMLPHPQGTPEDRLVKEEGDGLHWEEDDVLKVRGGIEHLPPLERDILEAILSGKSQQDLAVVHGMSQPGICWRLKIALKRIRWWYEWGDRFTEEEFLTDVARVERPQGCAHSWHPEYVARWWKLTNVSAVARDLKARQLTVRWHVMRWTHHDLGLYMALYGPDPWKTYQDAFQALWARQGVMWDASRHDHHRLTPWKKTKRATINRPVTAKPHVGMPRHLTCNGWDE